MSIPSPHVRPRHAAVWTLRAVVAACASGATCASAQTISAIQGIGHRSTFAGLSVAGVEGIVTAVSGSGSRGFFMQSLVPDADARTSEGLFVFTGSNARPNVGDRVTVGGRVDEFRAPASNPNPDNLSVTQINMSGSLGSWTRVSAGNALPAAVTLGGASLPSTTSIAPPVGNVESGTYTLNPGTHASDFYESLEGMRVTIPSVIAVGPNARFGEIPVISTEQAEATLRTARGGVAIGANSFNPHRMILDDRFIGGASMPAANVGDRLEQVVGVVNYDFENYKFEVTSAPTLIGAGLAAETATIAPGQLGIASYNVLNLGGNATAARMDAIAGQINGNLGRPHIVALQEIQDNNGATDNGVVAADVTLDRLVAAIAAGGGRTYAHLSIDPVNNADGGAPGGNIRTAFLYDPTVVSFSGVVGGSNGALAVLPDGTLSLGAGRIDPGNAAWTDSRKPLAAQFEIDGNAVIVINNHLNSKGPDQPLFGPEQPPQLTSETQRLQQVEVLGSFVEQILARNAFANIVLLGDINDFEFTPALERLEQAGLVNLTRTLPENERYTYLFDGNSQALDHMLVSRNLLDKGDLVYDIVHINAEFAQQVSDHDPLLLSLTVPAPVPEPRTWVSMIAGLLLLGGMARGSAATRAARRVRS
jgi:hypothetical protein